MLISIFLTIVLFNPGMCYLLPLDDKNNSFNSDEQKISMVKLNHEPLEIDLILFNAYDLDVSASDKPTQSVLNQKIILGFYGFRYSPVSSIEDLSAYCSSLKCTGVSSQIFEVIENNFYDLEGSDLMNLRIAIVAEPKAGEILETLLPDQKKQTPVVILWDTENEPQFPNSFLDLVTIIDFEGLKTLPLYTTQTKSRNTPNPSGPITYFTPPQINPEFIPNIQSFTRIHLRSQSKYLKNIDAYNLQYSISENNKTLIIDGIYNKTVKGGYPVPLPSISLPIDIIQELSNRREEFQDPEFEWLKDDILDHVDFFIDGQQIFTDNKSRLVIPEVFSTGSLITAKSDTSLFTIESSKLTRATKKHPATFELTVGWLKTPLILNIIDKQTRAPLHECKVIIDFFKSPKSAYSGKIYNGQPAKALFYNYPSVKYRITIDQPDYFQAIDNNIISDKDFIDGKTISIQPRPGFHFYYIDKESITNSLPDTLFILLKQLRVAHEKFLIYISNGEDPLLITEIENIKSKFNQALYMMPTMPQNEIEKNLILDAIPLDSIPMDQIIKLNFIYKTTRLQENKGRLIEIIDNELTSGILNRNTYIVILSDNELPQFLKGKDYSFRNILSN